MTIVFSLMFGIGVAVWVATKIAHRTGNADVRGTTLTAGMTGLFAFIFFLTLFKFVLHM